MTEDNGQQADSALWARPTPSGHLHLVEHVSRTDRMLMACGKEWHRDRLTLDFPSGARRCKECQAACYD